MSFYRLDQVAEEKVTDKLSRRVITGQNEMLAFVTLKKGCIVPNHKHPNEQMTYIEKGALKFTVNNRTIIVREGEILHMLPNVEHGAEALEDTLDLDLFSPPRQDWLTGQDKYLRQQKT